MTTLKTTKRNPEVKAKKLRRDGFATGVLYGREMDENIPLQFSAVDASRFIKSHKEGSQVILDFGDTKTSAIVKNIDYDAMKRQVMALDFQALVAGEAISTTVPVKLENEGAVNGVGKDAKLCAPSGLCMDANGVMYIGDTWNASIRKAVFE